MRRHDRPTVIAEADDLVIHDLADAQERGDHVVRRFAVLHALFAGRAGLNDAIASAAVRLDLAGRETVETERMRDAIDRQLPPWKADRDLELAGAAARAVELLGENEPIADLNLPEIHAKLRRVEMPREAGDITLPRLTAGRCRSLARREFRRVALTHESIVDLALEGPARTLVAAELEACALRLEPHARGQRPRGRGTSRKAPRERLDRKPQTFRLDPHEALCADATIRLEMTAHRRARLRMFCVEVIRHRHLMRELTAGREVHPELTVLRALADDHGVSAALAGCDVLCAWDRRHFHGCEDSLVHGWQCVLSVR